MGDSSDDGLWDSAGEEDDEDTSNFKLIEDYVVPGPGSEDDDDSDKSDKSDDSSDSSESSDDDDDDDKANDNASDDDDDDDDDADSDDDELAGMPELEKQKIIYEREQQKQLEQERKTALEIQKKRAEEEAKKVKKKDVETPDEESGEEMHEDIGRKRLQKKKISEISFDEDDDDSEEDEPIVKKKRRLMESEEDEDEEDNDDGVSDISDDQEEDEYYEEEDDETVKARMTLKDMNQLLLRRKALYRLIIEPYFEEYVKLKFVRVSIGAKDDGSPAYRVCQIVNLTEFKKPYLFASRKTKLGFLVKFGKSERIFSFNTLSNSSIIEPEYVKWIEHMKKCNLRIMTTQECVKIRKASLMIQQDIVYTPIIVRDMMKKHRKSTFTFLNTALEKSRLNMEYYEMKNAGRFEDAKQALARADAAEQYNNKRRREIHSEIDLGIVAINKQADGKNTYLGMKPGWYEYAGKTYRFSEDPFLTKPTRPGGVWLKNPPNKEKIASDDKAFWARKKKEHDDNFVSRKHLLLTKGRKGLMSDVEMNQLIDAELADFVEEKKHEEKDIPISYTYTFGLIGGVRPSPSQTIFQSNSDHHSSIQLDIDLNPDTAKPVHTGLGAVSVGGEMRHTKPTDIETCLTLHEYYERREMGEDNFMN